MYIRITWDPLKAVENQRKHGIPFTEAEHALSDERAIVVSDNRFEEQRFVTIGADSHKRVLVVVHSYPEESEELRIISVRKATRREARQYREET